MTQVQLRGGRRGNRQWLEGDLGKGRRIDYSGEATYDFHLMTYFRAKAFLLVLGVSQMLGTDLLSSPIFLQQSGDGDPSRAAETLAMSETHRKFIWDIEHWVFVLDHKVFPNWTQAFVENDRPALLEYFNQDCAGQILRPAEPAINTAAGQFTRIREATAPGQEADATNIVDYLFEYRNRFISSPGAIDKLIRFFAPLYASAEDEPPRVQVAMMELAPAEREKPAGPWRGTMKIRFTGRTTEGSVAEALIKARVTLDPPSDDLPDRTGWIHGFHVYSVNWGHSSDLLMKEVAAERGLQPEIYYDHWETKGPDVVITGGIYVSDYNRDGWLDVLVTGVKTNGLYRGGPGGFRNVTTEARLPENSSYGAAAFVDLDNDGYEDLLFGTRLYRNLGNGTFQDVTARTNLSLTDRGQNYSVVDYDLDGRMDLYVAGGFGEVKGARSWISNRSGVENVLLRNLGNWQFENVTEQTRTAGDLRSCFAAVWLDADGDGDPDVALADEFGRETILLNQGPGRPFKELSLQHSFGGFGMGLTAGDLNNDGHVDLYLAAMYSKSADRIIANLHPAAYPPDVLEKVRNFARGSEWFLNQGDLQFVRRGRAAEIASTGWSYGPSMVDLNNDGWLDLYVPSGFRSKDRNAADG